MPLDVGKNGLSDPNVSSGAATTAADTDLITPALRVKYPRTPHLPWSPGASADDRFIENLDRLRSAREVVVSEKLDGENVTLYRDHLHSRSIDFNSHPSRAALRAFHAALAHEIPHDWRVCGEYLFAQHSIHYSKLPSYFVAIAIFEGESCLSAKDTRSFCDLLGISMVPELYRGPWNEKEIKRCWTGSSCYGGHQEGYVVRTEEGFAFDDFANSVAKYVRANHVETDQNWLRSKIIRNHVLSGAN